MAVKLDPDTQLTSLPRTHPLRLGPFAVLVACFVLTMLGYRLLGLSVGLSLCVVIGIREQRVFNRNRRKLYAQIEEQLSTLSYDERVQTYDDFVQRFGAWSPQARRARREFGLEDLPKPRNPVAIMFFGDKDWRGRPLEGDDK